MTRNVFVWLHRWVGLLMTVFLIVVGLTGSLLAFNTQLEKLVSPQLFAVKPTPDAKRLDLATLAERAEVAQPHARVAYFSVSDEQAFMHVGPRTDPATGKPYPLDFNQMFLDPWSGQELGHRRNGDLSQGKINLIPFVYELHQSLALGETGAWVLGIVALAWTLDCFYAFYLTCPLALARFFSRWAPAWKIKWPTVAYRLNLDLHRASGLWLWPLLFVFAWSSVMFNLSSVYEWTTLHLFDYETPEMEISSAALAVRKEQPRLGWHEALVKSEQVMQKLAREQDFKILRATGLAYIAEAGVYSYSVDADRDISFGSWGGTGVWIDGDTGEFKKLWSATGEHSGNTVTNWLRALHFANIRDWLAYRILVCGIGLVIVLLSVTGVYIWFKKRRARLSAKQRIAVVSNGVLP